MKNILTKLLLMVTVLSMVVSLAVVPASAATINTYLLSAFSTEASTGAITSGNGMNLPIKDKDNNSYAYYNSGDEFFTVQTSKDFSVSGEAGTMFEQEFTELKKGVFQLKADVSFSGQTAEISWRALGVRNDGNSGRRKIAAFKDGKVYIGDGNQIDTGITYNNSSKYSLVIRYELASASKALDARMTISLSNGTNVQSYTADKIADNSNLSTIKGSGFVVNKPSNGTNVLKIYDGWSFSSLAGIPYFGSEIEGIDFSGYTAGTTNWENGADVPNTSTKYYTNTGNETSIVDESNGAFDGQSLKFDNKGEGGSQLRPQLSKIGPVRFEFKFKLDNFGTGETNFAGANGAKILSISTDGSLFFESDRKGVNKLNTNTWYMIRGYHNPGSTSSATDDYAYLELCTPDGKVTHEKSGILSNVGTSELKYMNLFASKGAVIYIDDLYVCEASALAPSTSSSFAVTSVSPSYDGSMPVYHDAQLTLTKAADTTGFNADNIYICKDGTRIDATGFSWNADNTVLSIPVNATGHYRICVFGLKDANGDAISNPYMEFDVTSPKVVFTASGSDVTATFKIKSADINDKTNAVMIIAGYAGGQLVAAPVIDSKSVSNEVTTLSATLTGGNDLTDVRVFVWESLGSLLPLAQTTNYR